VVVGSVVNGRRVIYPLVSVGGIPMEGMALIPFAQSQLLLPLPKVAAIPRLHNSRNNNNTNGSLLPSILSFSSLRCDSVCHPNLIAVMIRICVSQTAPRVSFSHFIVSQGTGRSSSPTPTTATSHSESELGEWGFHTSEISSFLCFPRSQASSQRFSRPR